MKQIIQYRVALFNLNIRYRNDNKRRFWTTAQIRVHFEDGGTGWLIFYDPKLTNATVGHLSGKEPLFFYPQQQYAAHLDLLRNEEPVFIKDDPEDFLMGSLRTGREDVGDGE
ncbi:MAG: hypothetical protein IIA72_23640 [Proteobacteria bacterium]|nr:hypothetical protein [Pseudomonadota bacterium]